LARHNKNRRRCNISKKRLNISFFYKILIVLLFAVIISFFLVSLIDKRISLMLDKYIGIEVERLTTNIVSRAVDKITREENYNNYLIINKANELKIESISYNTKEINKLTDKISRTVQENLLNLENGDLDEFFISDKFKRGKFKNVRNGLVCDISLGSIKNSTLFANVGPTIPIKLTFIGQVNTELDVVTKEYGINNVLIEIYVIVKVRELASMPLTSEEREIVIREPIAIDIIKGEIPDYYGGITK